MPVYAVILEAPEAPRVPVGPKEKHILHGGLRLRVGVLRDPYGHRLMTFCYPYLMRLQEAETKAVAIYHRNQERTL